MGADAKIIVLGDEVLVSLFSSWFACTYMWEGILVEDEGFFASGYSKFEDALYVITIDDGGVVNLFGNTFNRDYIGIRNGDSSPNYAGPVFYNFTNNVFTCTSALNETEIVDVTYAGMYFNKTVAAIGNIYSPNYFSFLLNGVISVEASIYTANLHFDEMLEETDDSGYGINTIGGSLVLDAALESNSWIGRSTFENCRLLALSHRGTNLDITGVQVSGHMWGGFESYLNKEGQTIRVENSFFDMEMTETYGGALIKRGIGSGDLAHYFIRYDTFVIDNGGGATFGLCIDAEYPAIDEAHIYFNEFQDNKSARMSQLLVAGSNVDGYKIKYNNLYSSASTFIELHYGIVAFDIFGQEHEISYNTISGSGSHQPLQCAIHVELAPNILLCDNNVNLTQRGVHLVGPNSPLYLKDTEFGINTRGLLVSNFQQYPGSIGPQVRFGNTWSSTQSDYAENAAELDPGVNPDFSRFRVQSSAITVLPPKRQPISNWFSVVAGDMDTCVEQNIYIPPISLSVTDTAIISGSSFDTSYNKVVRWDMQKDLMFKLYRFPELRPTSSDAEAYFDDNQDSSFSNHAYWELMYFNAMLPSDSVQNVVDSLYELIRDGLVTLGRLDTVVNWHYDTSSFDRDVVDTVMTWLDSIRILMVPYQLAKDSIQGRQISELNDLEADLGSLPKSENYENGNAIILNAMFYYALNDSLSVSLLSDIEDLSEEDISSYGISVSKARKLLYPCTEEPIAHEPSEESESIIANTAGDEPAQNLMMQVENPATQSIGINWNRKVSGELRIISLSGSIINSFKIENTDWFQASINTPNGAYIVQYLDLDGTTVLSDKLIVSN